MELKNVITQRNNEVLIITINREEKLNALNHQVIDELHHVFTEASTDNSVGGVIITGAGNKAFVAGADIAAFQNLTAEEGEALARYGQEKVFDLIEGFNKPVIAAINGFALGGGLELAMACHVRLAAEHAKMGLPEVTLGLIPGYGGTQRLVQLVGKGKALEMILTGAFISATDARDYGLVNKVMPAENLLDEAITLLKSMLKNSPEALASAIKSVNYGLYTKGYEKEIALFGSCFSTKNAKEGIAAFIAKRKPDFVR